VPYALNIYSSVPTTIKEMEVVYPPVEDAESEYNGDWYSRCPIMIVLSAKKEISNVRGSGGFFQDEMKRRRQREGLRCDPKEGRIAEIQRLQTYHRDIKKRGDLF